MGKEPTILFPSEFKEGNPSENSVLIFASSKIDPLEARITDIVGIMRVMTGKIAIANKGFVTGAEVYRKLKEAIVNTRPDLSGRLAIFDQLGQLDDGGNYEDFVSGFNSNFAGK